MEKKIKKIRKECSIFYDTSDSDDKSDNLQNVQNKDSIRISSKGEKT